MTLDPLRICANCAHWNDEGGWSHWRHPEQWKYCRLAESHDGKADHDRTIVIAQDAESYHARLETHGAFGCNQFLPAK